MKTIRWMILPLVVAAAAVGVAVTSSARGSSAHDPTWWDKYTYLAKNGPTDGGGTTSSLTFGSNVDISNECGPQSETFITINTAQTKNLAAGSNEIFRLPMRGYFTTDGGKNWGGVDLPLPPPKGNGIDFGSDPSLAFDSRGNLFYSYIVVFFGNGTGINGTEMAVARSTDGGKTYPTVSFFSFENGSNHFNDKPMITTDLNAASRFRDNIYVAWNDYAQNVIAFNRSFDGGNTWDTQRVVSPKTVPFEIAVPAEFFRKALVYPSLGVDTSNGPHRGRLYCSWTDLTASGISDIFLSYSDDKGTTWSSPQPVTDRGYFADRFNHWMSVDPLTGYVSVAFYDTRFDTTGQRYMTDYFLSQSRDGGVTWLPNVRVSNQSSNEHDCNGVYPCDGINYGNQQGDYEGLVSYGGTSYPVWTDSRRQLVALPGCSRGLAMEEVFTAKVTP
jgi:hypothetical protein